MTEQIDVYRRKYEKAKSLLDPVYARGNENARYYRGENWTERDRMAHRAQGFYHAYAVPLIAVKLNRILSMQRANRFEGKARGRGLEDELTAEVINMILKYVDDVNQFKWLESEIYQEGLTKVYGVLKVDIDFMRHPLGEIALLKIPFDQFYFDTNSLNYDLSDATFMGEYKWVPADQAAALFPETDFTKNVDTNRGDMMTNAYNSISTSYFARASDSLKVEDWLNEKQRLVKICEHYDLTYEQRHLVKNLETGDFIPFPKKQEAEAYVMNQLMMAPPEAQVPENFVVIKKSLPVWKKIIFTGDTVITQENHRYSTTPYHRYAALFDNGRCWSLTDLAKDSQKAFDRTMSMMDKSMAKNIKGNNYVIMPDRLHPSETKDMDDLFARLSSGGSYIKAVNSEVIAPINKFSDIRIESAIAQNYQAQIEDLLGGRTYQGLESSSRQTATEVMTLERNATQTGLLFADNLARWKQNVYNYVVEIIKDIYTPDRTIRVVGEVATQEIKAALEGAGIYKPSQIYAGEVGYLDLKNLPKPMADCELDIVIDNVESSRIDRDEKFQQILALNEVGLRAYGQPLPFELILKYSKLDPTIKQALSEYQQQAQAQAEQAKQMAMDMEKAKQLTEMAKTLKPQESTGGESEEQESQYSMP